MIMNKDELQKELAEILQTDASELTDNVLLSDIGFDSIQFITFIVAVEEKYDIEVLDSDLMYENFDTLNKIYATLSKYFEEEKKLYKCIITDCDGVLWRGIAGEAGLDKAYYDTESVRYCELLHDLRQRGVLVTICSRNEEENIMEMLPSNGTALTAEDFVLIETCVTAKADSAAQIASELGIYQESIVFVDDSDHELAIIAEFLPDMKTVKADSGFVDKIISMFEDIPESTDIDRTAQFRQQKNREEIHLRIHSAEEYNEILDTVSDCRYADVNDAARIAELSQRTNRFNTSGCRYSEGEVRSMLSEGETSVYIIGASDKFGDMGIVGAAVVRDGGDTAVIESFMLSCRVFGRDFEKILLDKVIADTKKPLRGIWKDTGKNGYCHEFFVSHGIAAEE